MGSNLCICNDKAYENKNLDQAEKNAQEWLQMLQWEKEIHEKRVRLEQEIIGQSIGFDTRRETLGPEKQKRSHKYAKQNSSFEEEKRPNLEDQRFVSFAREKTRYQQDSLTFRSNQNSVCSDKSKPYYKKEQRGLAPAVWQVAPDFESNTNSEKFYSDETSDYDVSSPESGRHTVAREDTVNAPFVSLHIKGPLSNIGMESDSSSNMARGVFTPLNESEEELYERLGILKP